MSSLRIDSSVGISFFLILIIVMMVLPVPSFIVDFGLALSFGFAVLIFVVAIFINEPLDFSSFPSVVVASLMLRLTLNVSSTKLIIGEGHTGTDAAGDVIEGFAMFVMNGNIFIGLVVFTVLLIVNFIVINKGATRMAEVSARFALDGMPGKQLSIDSDVAAGAIDHTEARARREKEQAETSFFGSLDGASKFVKGDAIAGLLITCLNLIMGLLIGIILHDLSIAAAFETYAILTVGDGLVNQIPAVIISFGSALLLARGNSEGEAHKTVMSQISKRKNALFLVAIILFIFGLVPGLPFIPFISLSIGFLLFSTLKSEAHPTQEQTNDPIDEDQEEKGKNIGDMLQVFDIHVEFAPDLLDIAIGQSAGLEGRINGMRDYIALNFGMIIPEVRITDQAALPASTYTISLQGVEYARDTLKPNSLLVLKSGKDGDLPPGQDVAEPVYGAPARWITEDVREQATMTGHTVISPSEVFATHLLEILKQNLSNILSIRQLHRLLDTFLSSSDHAAANRRLYDELVPDKVPLDLLHAVLRLLLAEEVSIRNLPLILEAVAEGRQISANVDEVHEHVRQRLGMQIVSKFRNTDGTLPIIQIAPDWEKIFAQYQKASSGIISDVALPPDIFTSLTKKISDSISKSAEAGTFPVIATSAGRRRFIRSISQAKGVANPVLSFEEIGMNARPSLAGVVKI